MEGLSLEPDKVGLQSLISNYMIRIGSLFLGIFSVFVIYANTSAPFSLSVGTQSIGVRYQFTEQSALVESAEAIASLGSDTLKIACTPKYADDYRMTRDPKIDSLLKLIERKPAFQEVMDMPFRNIMLWVYPFSDSKSAFAKGEVDPREVDAIYNEIYEFTVYLLKRYSGSGKSFFLGNWEGDWHLLLEKYNYQLDPSPKAIAGAIDWFRLREKAIADARSATPHHDVHVYYYIELNHVGKSMDADRPTIVNRVLPYIETDYVSWSSYDVTKPAAKLGGEAGRQRVLQALDYIESHLPESNISGKRVFIGEYGFELSNFESPEKQMRLTASIMKWSLEWGCPFVLYWELYCNEIEPSTGAHRGYWMIDNGGQQQPVWHLHNALLKQGDAFIKNYKAEHGSFPSQADYNRKVVSWIDAFIAKDSKAQEGPCCH